MEILKREKIGNKVFFNTVNNSKFKTMKMSVSAYLPLKKETASQNALLCDILTRSCKEYNTLAILEKKLLSLYGASLSSHVKKEGDLQVLTISVSGLDDRYVFDDTKISSELAEILCKIIFEPNVSGNEFTERDFKQSLHQLLDTIDSEFNEKRIYAVSRCVEIMNKNSNAGISRLGDKESAEKATPKDMYFAWRNLLKSAHFEIMYVGDGDSISALNIFKKKFETIARAPEKLSTETFKSDGNIKEVSEEMELSQSKLVMGFETGVCADDDNYCAMMLLSAILGGTPSAKLFSNVREKQSLCYYCISQYNRRKGYIIVESGVERANLEKAKNAILNEVNELVKGNITDFEIESAKLAMINGYKSIADTVTGIESWYLTRILDKKIDTPEETAEKIKAVTKEQLLELAKNIKLDTVYMLKNIRKIESLTTGDKYYKINHKSGLTIYVYPKEKYSSAYAIFGTKYGSINKTFSVDKGEKITVPDGIAHYLEHKLFESEDGDAFTRYAKTGASANAYTSFEKTCYLFSCSDNFKANLEILLDFVQNPYFTAETVEKEQGIIGQEIKMYEDDPDWRVMFNLLECLYHNHPVKIDIAGTVETISEITAEKLYEVYNTFYNLNNMVLCVTGNVTVDEVLEVCDKKLKESKHHKIINYFEKEPYEIVKTYTEQKLTVSVPLFNLGFKEKAGDKMLTAKENAEINILLTMLFSPSSELYSELLEEELINSSFSYEVFEGPGYLAILFGGESRNPEKAAIKITNYISKVKLEGISEEDFEAAKRACYGDSLSSLNNIESVANSLVTSHFSGNEFFEYTDALADVAFKDVESRLNKILDISNCALSVVRGE